MASFGIDLGEPTIARKLAQVRWSLVLLLSVISCVGFAMLYSAGDGSLEPWAGRQMIRYGGALALLLFVAVVDIRLWLRLAYPIYILALLLLIAVEFTGTIGMGARRWVDLGIVQLQPSEVMKIALVLALARYFHGLSLDEAGRPSQLVLPVALVLVPVFLVLRQPDLGTAVLMASIGVTLFFLAGVRRAFFGWTFVSGLAAVPVLWQFLEDYQKRRILTFFDPESDPLGAGYHILQSKIALGSGGLMGRGFMEGTQSHLSFLPEQQTDFIFTMLAEEFGLVGGLALLVLYAIVLAYAVSISLQANHQFGRLVAQGVAATFFFYVFVNVAMVMGLVPVVGVPLPLVSYGGTSMLAIMIGFGLLMSVHIHRDVQIPRRASSI